LALRGESADDEFRLGGRYQLSGRARDAPDLGSRRIVEVATMHPDSGSGQLVDLLPGIRHSIAIGISQGDHATWGIDDDLASLVPAA